MLASSIADVPLGFKGLDESSYHVQATAVRLNKRRNAKNPVMPMPKSAIEVGSGTAAVATPMVRLPCDPAVTPVSEALENVIAPGVLVVNANTKDPLAAAVKLASIVFGAISVYVIPERLELTVVTGPIGSTPGEYVISISVAVPGLVTVNDAVVVTVPAWLGVANATLASKPAATVKKSDRFVIEFS
jgi:hypothetical protein